MSKQSKNRKGKLGQSGKNKQWVKEHKAHRAKLFFGDTDKLTGKVLGEKG